MYSIITKVCIQNIIYTHTVTLGQLYTHLANTHCYIMMIESTVCATDL